jgi:hypothetical protein
MPGGFTPHTGSSIPPTKVFLGTIADRFTMLWPKHWVNGVGPHIDAQIAAKNLNTWTPVNPNIYTGAGPNAPSVTLGALTTAPDGTNTAQHIIEAALAGAQIHSLQAYLTTAAQNGGFKLRLAVAAKAGINRTRIKLVLDDGSGPGGLAVNGCQTIFDLAGGQIGIANTAFSSSGPTTWTAGPSSITKLPNGFYNCMMDITIPLGFSPNFGLSSLAVGAKFYIDAGSGTGAENTTYVGDGTSSIIVWNSSVLPPRAWALNNQVFFDDFGDPAMGTIDLNNTGLPGFNWYPRNICPQFPAINGIVPTPANQFSWSASKVTIGNAVINTGVELNLMSIVYAGGTSYIGNAWKPPFLAETSFGFFTSAPELSFNQIWWFSGAETLCGPIPPAPGSTDLIGTYELDVNEGAIGGNNPPPLPVPGGNWWWRSVFSPAIISDRISVASGVPWVGVTNWVSTWLYGTGQVPVFYPSDGNFYLPDATNGGGTGNIPPSSPTHWHVVASPTAQWGYVPRTFDPFAQHDISVLWLPVEPIPGGDFGHIMVFADGILGDSANLGINIGNGHNTYSPALGQPGSIRSGYPPISVIDGQHYPFMYGVGTATVTIGFARVTQ